VPRLLESDDQALLAYSTGDSSSTCWVVTRAGATRFTLPPARALRLRMEVLRRALATPGGWAELRTRAASEAAWTVLIGPALPALARVRRLVIVADGPLLSLPFEALRYRDAGGRMRFLVERFDVAYAPSVTSIAARPRSGRTGAGGVLAVADPAFDSALSPDLAPLPGTRLELEALAGLAPPRAFASLTGPAATRAALLAHPRLGDADIVHLATHGVADAIEPSRSGLWFAADSGTSFLSAPEVMRLRLDASLVVLSACETGLGRVERGEGVLGLPRAFLAAGAGSVVVSLWSVSDRSTAELMRDFYAGLLRAGLPRDRALAQAKRALLRVPGMRDPVHWAAFVLMGDWGTLGR
jgi:CHAT domain-containing protein